MKYEGVSFNEKFAKRFTEKQFVEHICNQHLWPKATLAQRKARLKEVYKLIKIK